MYVGTVSLRFEACWRESNATCRRGEVSQVFVMVSVCLHLFFFFFFPVHWFVVV